MEPTANISTCRLVAKVRCERIAGRIGHELTGVLTRMLDHVEHLNITPDQLAGHIDGIDVRFQDAARHFFSTDLGEPLK